ncbi:MAG: 3-phosphoserine/phosphohydroxythreonine transaminase [Methylococcaceae bacterium]|jgi:phosphoserine aminotransferase
MPARVYNFSAGPSALPVAVLERAQDELLSWRDSGMSVMEMSHRGQYFAIIAEELEADLRELLVIPNNYQVLFLQGGATAQFSFIPQNILAGKTTACYVQTGTWSEKAITEAQNYCQVIISASSLAENYTCIPDAASWQVDDQAAYLHYTANETIHGVEFFEAPDSQGLPLVSDMSSNILSRCLDISQFGLIYACAQKNMGSAGVTVVIIRDDLIDLADKKIPGIFNYAKQASHKSMLNTPVTYHWYLSGLVLKWTKQQGGVEAFERLSQLKAEKLYSAIDQSTLYQNHVSTSCRSRMNIPFTLAEQSLQPQFLAQAHAHGLAELAGHRAVGGLRASIYNAMPEQGVQALVDFMAEFERTH